MGLIMDNGHTDESTWAGRLLTVFRAFSGSIMILVFLAIGMMLLVPSLFVGLVCYIINPTWEEKWFDIYMFPMKFAVWWADERSPLEDENERNPELH
jgi:hypothetical protein